MESFAQINSALVFYKTGATVSPSTDPAMMTLTCQGLSIPIDRNASTSDIMNMLALQGSQRDSFGQIVKDSAAQGVGFGAGWTLGSSVVSIALGALLGGDD